MWRTRRTRFLVLALVVLGALVAAAPAAAQDEAEAVDHDAGVGGPHPVQPASDPDPNAVEPATWGLIKVQFSPR
jgi:hypothetical protein